MATHSSNRAWEIPRAEEPGKLQSMRSQKSRMRLKNNKNQVGILKKVTGCNIRNN